MYCKNIGTSVYAVSGTIARGFPNDYGTAQQELIAYSLGLESRCSSR
jgi:hypothetical protein